MANAGGHGGVFDDDGESVRRPPADPVQDSDHRDEEEAAASQRGVEHDGGEFYSLRSWGELLRRWLGKDDDGDDDDSFCALPAWRGCAPATSRANTTPRHVQVGATRQARARGLMGASVTAPAPASTVRDDASTSKSAPASMVRDDASTSKSAPASMVGDDASGTGSESKSAPPDTPLLPFMKASDAASAFKSIPPDAYAAMHALMLACSKASGTASASAPPMPPEAYAALHALMLACSKASDTASASAPPMPPEAYAALHSLVLACSKTSDTASASPPPPPNAHALAFLDAQDLLSFSRRFATSLENCRVNLAAPADELARSMSTFVEKIGEKSNGLDEAASNVRKAVSTLLAAADSPKASEKLAGEARDLAGRILQLILVVEEQAREEAAGAKVDEDLVHGCERCADRMSCCLWPWLFGSCTSPRLPSGGCSCCSSRPRRAVDDKQEALQDKWSTFFTFSMPASLSVLPLLERHISQSYSALLGFAYGGIFLSAAAGLLLSMNAMTDSDLEIARCIGNFSVLSLSVLVSLYVWTLFDPGSIVMIVFLLAALAIGHGCAWRRCCSRNRDPHDTADRGPKID